jgi:hypothetical protein
MSELIYRLVENFQENSPAGLPETSLNPLPLPAFMANS